MKCCYVSNYIMIVIAFIIVATGYIQLALGEQIWAAVSERCQYKADLLSLHR